MSPPPPVEGASPGGASEPKKKKDNQTANREYTQYFNLRNVSTLIKGSR
jgi:hypothetical protein